MVPAKEKGIVVRKGRFHGKGFWALFALLAVLTAACQSTNDSQPSSPDEIVQTHHFHITNVNRCLSKAELKKVMREAHEAKVKLLERIGPYIRPGDFYARKRQVSAIAPAKRPTPEEFLPDIPPIRARVVDRPGRSFTDKSGIEIAKHYIGRHDVTHELVHYLAGSSWAPADEGLACYLTELLWGPEKKASLDLRVLVYIDLSMLRSLKPSRLEKGMSRVDYDASGSFVKYLVTKYGWDRFFQLYHGPKGNYLWVYGASEDELIYEWRKSLAALKLTRSGDFYRFRARITTGLQGATK
ncbi:MAG: hypothetical protein P1V97_14325 [Planctomycetota bacterium]|nr:hypothetical protein [Planctomycetota bacterium]